MSELEKRYFDLDSEIETRDDSLEVSGYGIVFDKESVLLGDFKEVISKRALDDVDMSDVYLFSQHNSTDILGSTSSGTMTLNVTDKGLHFRANLPDTNLGRDTYTLIKRGDLKSCSFAFTVSKDTWDMTKSPEIRTVHQIGKLGEISVVTHPAYEDTNVSRRSLDVLKECKNCRLEKDSTSTAQNELAEQAKEILASIKQ